MKCKIIFSVAMTCLIFSCNNGKRKIVGSTPFQKQLNAQYKDASRSPLKDKDRREFKGLPFFDLDSSYVVNAMLTKTPNSKWVNMKTTTSRLSKQRLYGVLKFKIKDAFFKLNVYQGENPTTDSGLDDYLFLPFKAGVLNLDATIDYVKILLRTQQHRIKTNRPLTTYGVVNFYKERSRINRELKEELKTGLFNKVVGEKLVFENEKIKELAITNTIVEESMEGT